MSAGVNNKTQPTAVGSLSGVNPDPQARSQNDLPSERLGQNESLGHDNSTLHDQTDATPGSERLPSQPPKQRNMSGDIKDQSLLKSLLNKRSRKFSEPSSAFDEPEPDSQRKSSMKDVRRSRQDSVSSTGFGSSHFGSSLKRKDSVGSAQRINFVADAASIIPTLSIDHLPLLNESQLNDCEGEELKDLESHGEDLGSDKPVTGNEGDEEYDPYDTKSSGKNKWSHHLPEIPETDAVNQTGNGSSGRKPSLGSTAVGDLVKLTPEEEEAWKKAERRKYMKNLLVLCTGFFFVFTAFLSLRNLQSSLNAKGGLGLYALSATYACFFLGCIMATTVVQRLGPKRAIVVSTTGPFLYVLANFYPLFYTLIPAAASAGFCQGVIWTAHATYIANIAASYTELTNEKIQIVLSRFNGIFFVFYQSCQIIGGMISSIILKSPEEPLDGFYFNGTWYNLTTLENGTMASSNFSYPNQTLVRDYSHCGIGYCPHTAGVKGAAPVERKLVFILVGVFTACCLTGILVLAFMLDKLEGQMKKTKASVGKQLVAVFKFYCNRYAICMVGIMFYSLLQAAFMFGEYNKAFVTCTIGIHMVGFVMMTLSSSSAIAAFVNGRIQKWTSRPPLLAAAFLFQFGVFMVLLFWKPNPADTPVFFILVIFWGMGDGIIMTQDISIIGFLFAHNKEPAFAALKMTQSIANFSFFMVAPYLCTTRKIAFVFTVLVIASIGYFSLEGILLYERKQEKKSADKTADAIEAKKPIKT